MKGILPIKGLICGDSFPRFSFVGSRFRGGLRSRPLFTARLSFPGKTMANFCMKSAFSSVLTRSEGFGTLKIIVKVGEICVSNITTEAL